MRPAWATSRDPASKRKKRKKKTKNKINTKQTSKKGILSVTESYKAVFTKIVLAVLEEESQAAGELVWYCTEKPFFSLLGCPLGLRDKDMTKMWQA